MDWVSVEDRMPEEWANVVIRKGCADGPLVPCVYHNGRFVLTVPPHHLKNYKWDERSRYIRECIQDWIDLYVEGVTHWMPFPSHQRKPKWDG